MLKTVQGGPGVPLLVHRPKLYPQTHFQRTTSPGKARVPFRLSRTRRAGQLRLSRRRVSTIAVPRVRVIAPTKYTIAKIVAPRVGGAGFRMVKSVTLSIAYAAYNQANVSA